MKRFLTDRERDVVKKLIRRGEPQRIKEHPITQRRFRQIQRAVARFLLSSCSC